MYISWRHKTVYRFVSRPAESNERFDWLKQITTSGNCSSCTYISEYTDRWRTQFCFLHRSSERPSWWRANLGNIYSGSWRVGTGPGWTSPEAQSLICCRNPCTAPGEYAGKELNEMNTLIDCLTIFHIVTSARYKEIFWVSLKWMVYLPVWCQRVTWSGVKFSLTNEKTANRIKFEVSVVQSKFFRKVSILTPYNKMLEEDYIVSVFG